MSPKSDKLLQQLLRTHRDELVTGEQDNVDMAHLGKLQTATTDCLNALEAHIEKLERGAAALRAIKARIDGVFDDPDLMACGALSTDSCHDVYQITIGALK